MTPDRIRLIHLKTQTVGWHKVDAVSWDKVWAVSHVWDRRGNTKIPMHGVSWKSMSFSSANRFKAVFKKTRQIVKSRGAEYVWMDAACIDQDREEEKEGQVPFMGAIYSKSAGCVAFGTLTPDDRFVEIVSTYDGGRKAWVCDWFERVWTFQELQLPKELLFVSGDHVLTRDEVYLSILMMSPYLTSRHPSPPSHPNDPSLSIQDVLNTLAPSSKINAQRSLMQTSKRGCSKRYVHDKVYGILGVLSEPLSKLKVDYSISLSRALLNLMKLMPPNDVLDTLTFNTLPPADKIHDTLHWSGMVMLDRPMEYPSYETDIYRPTNALIAVVGEAPRACTVVHNAPLWKVVVTRPENPHAELVDTRDRGWLSAVIVHFCRYAKYTDDFTEVERSADYATAVRRVERSLAANLTRLEAVLRRGVDGGEELLSILHKPPFKAKRTGGVPPNRLGDATLFDQEVTVLVCRSKADMSFHYGIVATPNEDGSWHKVCTTAFSDSCVVPASRTHVESVVMIGR